MSTLLLDSLAHRKDQGVLDQAQFRKLQAQYRAILSQGRQRHPRRTGHGAQGKATNLLNRLEDFDLNVLAFTLFEEVPFTNNGAERDIRHEKTGRGWAAFAPCTGPESLPDSQLHLHLPQTGQNALDALEKAITGSLIPSAPPAGP